MSKQHGNNSAKIINRKLRVQKFQRFYSMKLNKIDIPPEFKMARTLRIVDELDKLHGFEISNVDLVSLVLANV